MAGKITAKLLREVLEGWGRGVDCTAGSSQGKFNELALEFSVPRFDRWIAELEEKEEREKAQQASSSLPA